MHEERIARFARAGLYVVITAEFCAGRDPLDVLDQCLAAGVRLVQCREKHLSDREYLSLARAMRARTAEAGALLIVDDRVDIALAAQADGVHLGTDDLPIADARALAPEMLIGASTHNLDEAQAAQSAGASYVNIGPIYATQTKTLSMGALGPEAISEIAPHLHIPFSCMGGIKPHNAGELVARGARTLAVVTAVTAAAEVAEAVRTFDAALDVSSDPTTAKR